MVYFGGKFRISKKIPISNKTKCDYKLCCTTQRTIYYYLNIYSIDLITPKQQYKRTSYTHIWPYILDTRFILFLFILLLAVRLVVVAMQKYTFFIYMNIITYIINMLSDRHWFLQKPMTLCSFYDPNLHNNNTKKTKLHHKFFAPLFFPSWSIINRSIKFFMHICVCVVGDMILWITFYCHRNKLKMT